MAVEYAGGNDPPLVALDADGNEVDEFGNIIPDDPYSDERFAWEQEYLANVEREQGRAASTYRATYAARNGRMGAARRSKGQVAVDRLNRMLGALGTRLIAQADQALEAAIDRAGGKVITRSKSRLGSVKQRRIRSLVREGQPLGPVLAQVGIQESELLDTAFDGFHKLVVQAFDEFDARAAVVVEQAGLDPSTVPQLQRRSEDAADYLCAALIAEARMRLLQGTQAAVLAASRRPPDWRKIPRARPVPTGGWDDWGIPGTPSPETLQAASARLVRNAIGIAEGRMEFRMPGTPDSPPEVISTQVLDSLAERLGVNLELKTVWTWRWGFYGTPKVPFEPHADQCDGHTTTNRETPEEEDFTADEGEWPFVAVYVPGDHDHCTCEWVLEGVE